MINKEFYSISKKLFADNKILYVSTPITTGEKFIEWYEVSGKYLDVNSDSYKESHKINVIAHNILNAKSRIKRIRLNTNNIVIDPTNLESNDINWSQDEFYCFWDGIIENIVSEVVFLDGWEFSLGCCTELQSALKYDIKILNQDMQHMDIFVIIQKLKRGYDFYKSNGMKEAERLDVIIKNVQVYECNKNRIDNNNLILKDEKLHYLIDNNIANVAQFISIEPSSKTTPKYIHINNKIDSDIYTIEESIKKLIQSAPSKSVNIRSFSSQTMKGNPLIRNKTIMDLEEILKIINKNSLAGKHTIVNENINIYDSGVSGVALGGMIEFSPEDSPKCVDKEGICSLSRSIGLSILEIVYGFSPDLHFDPSYRIEFSIHPSRQGVNKEHTIIWEYEHYENVNSDKKVIWPNNFSRFIGDKVFGLILAYAYGLPVPKTTVISRKIAPFTFGEETGLAENWIRTCPIIKEPGKYYTGDKWIDPFEMINKEETKGINNTVNIASILSQKAVEAKYSGASIIMENKSDDLIEGVAGNGDKFMVGESGREQLPYDVVNKVKILNNKIRTLNQEIGNVSIEWVYDGSTVWIVQLNQLKSSYTGDNNRVIVMGSPSYYEKVYVKNGLENLRENINKYKESNIGIQLIGDVGVTSHFGDLLRQSNIPSIINPSNTSSD